MNEKMTIKKIFSEFDEKDVKENICNRPMLIYSRVVGFIRPVENWNDAKRQEFVNRRNYKVFYGQDQVNRKDNTN